LKPIIVAIAGGSGSGKTTLARKIRQNLGQDKCSILSQDHYYHDQSHKFDGDGGSVNFDHPSSLDFDLLAEHLGQLKKGLSIQVPVYDFVTHRRKKEYELMFPSSVIVLDGTLLFSQPKILEKLDYKLFVDVPESVRFERRLKRDVQERGRTPDGVRKQFESQVKPMHDQFIEPSKKFADHLTHDHFDVNSFCNIIVHQS
jgi:uridine kinase